MNEAEIISKLQGCEDKIGLDIGSNHGCYVGAIAGKCREVHAFEPHPDNFKKIQENPDIKNNPKAILYNKAVGINHNTPAKLYCCDNPGGHSIAELVGHSNKWGHNKDRSITVDMVSIDELFKDRLDIGFMKIDVEGYEEWVLLSARKILETNRVTIALETHQTINCQSIYDYMTSMGYYFFEGTNQVTKIEMDHRYLVQKV